MIQDILDSWWRKRIKKKLEQIIKQRQLFIGQFATKIDGHDCNNQSEIRRIKAPLMSDNYNSGGSFIVNNNKHHQKIYGQRSRAEKS